MPTYEYECQACGNKLEAFQRITEAPLVDCPACNQPSLMRIISAAAFQLKGGGWYKDGYGSASSGSKGSDNDRGDRMTKALDKDNTKTESASSDSSGSSGTPTSTTTSSGGSDKAA